MKCCTKCHEIKPLGEFHRQAKSSDGRLPKCKACHKVSVYAWRAENPDRHRSSALKSSLAYQRRNPISARLVTARLRAEKLGVAVESFTPEDLLGYWQSVGIDKHRCYYSGVPLDEGWQLDHKTPLSRGGGHVMANIVPCTAFVNGSKHRQTEDEYRARFDTERQL